MTDNLSKLPYVCYAVAPGKGGLVVVMRGVSGYVQADLELVARTMNESMSVTPAQAEAMLLGSMFGWDMPGADPDRYDEEGKLKRRRDGT